MKRSPLTRKTPLRRTRLRRKPARPNPAGSDPAHLRWLRTLPCCCCGFRFPIEAHHSTVGRGLSQKTSDREAMPLCLWCHRDFHGALWYFAGWTKAKRKTWQLDMVSRYAPGGVTA